MLDVMLDRFDNHDRVVHDEADCENESKKRQRIDGETQHRKNGKRAHQRDGYRE